MPSERLLLAAEEFNRIAERMAAPGRCDPTLSFETPQLAEVVCVWRDKASGRNMPLRRDMDARTLKAYLPNVAIVDVVESGDMRRYRFRVMGTSISQVLGDHTGKFIDEAIVSPFCERWCAAMDAALMAGGPIRVTGRVEYRQRDHLVMELMLAPIGPRDESAEAVLVVAYATSSARHVFDPLVRNTVSAQPGNKTLSL